MSRFLPLILNSNCARRFYHLHQQRVVPGGPDKRAALAQNPLSAPEFHGGGFDTPFLLGPELFLAQF